jgi:hypothetical protein
MNILNKTNDKTTWNKKYYLNPGKNIRRLYKKAKKKKIKIQIKLSLSGSKIYVLKKKKKEKKSQYLQRNIVFVSYFIYNQLVPLWYTL